MLCAVGRRSSLLCSVLRSVFTLTLSLILASCFEEKQTLDSAARSPVAEELEHFIVKVGKRVEIAASYNYCWFPTVHRFSTGEILTTMRTSPDETNPEGEFSAYCLSKDGGETWSRRYTMGAGANIDGAYSQDPLEDGAIWMLGAGWASLEPYPHGQKTDFHVTLTKFSRNGMEIDQIRDARVHLSEPVHFIPVELYATKAKDASGLDTVPTVQPVGAIIGGPGGERLNTLSYTTERDQRFTRLVMIRSIDQGQTWDEYGTIAALQPNENPWPWMGQEGPGEAGLVRLSDSRLYCIFRTGNGEYLGEAWSFDDGKTWTPPTSSGFKGVAPHLRLMSNGLLVCTFGRPGPVTIMFSADEGKKWVAITPISNEKSTRYTDVIEVEPGKLLVVYDGVPDRGDLVPSPGRLSKRAIYGTFVEVRRR
jgi:BNR repeat-like domain